MENKVFLSYAHKDEKFKKDLEDHLSMLKRNNIIDTWSDRDITAGSKWEHEIQSNLNEADIILCLVSSAFLASDYCYCKEFTKSLERHKTGECRIIPIIVRACDWHNSPIGEIQATPKDGKPVASYTDQDSAWMDVIGEIKRVIEELKKKNISTAGGNLVSKDFNDFLKDTTIPLNNDQGEVYFQDIYIPPYLKCLEKDKYKKYGVESLLKPGKYILLGDEQAGKTSLLKHLFQEKNKDGIGALYLDLLKIRSLKDPNHIIQESLRKIYPDREKETINILLLDNFDKAHFNRQSKEAFINYLNSSFEHIIVSFNYSNNYIKEDLNCFNDYIEYGILDFGYEKREDLIRKWLSIGKEDSISEEELYKNIDEIIEKIDSILLKDILPSQPMYILLILQLLESRSNAELTSYGHCYQQLIYKSFDYANIKKSEFDKYMNVLKEISWEFFNKNNMLSIDDINRFFIDYGEKFLSVDKDVVLKKLLKANILKLDNENGYSFRYPYIYYFFVGMKISDSYLNESLVSEKVDKIFHKLYRDDYSKILVFISHHTREPWINSRIIEILENMFKDYRAARLDSNSLGFMKKFSENIPTLITEHKSDVSEKRREKNKERDLIQGKNNHEYIQKEESEYDYPLLIKDIQILFKSVEIIGQIIRNRHSSLRKDDLYNLVKEGINSSLRFMNYVIEVSDVTKDRAVDFIHGMINGKKNYTDSELKEKVEYFYLFITYRMIYSILRKIGISIGSKEAMEIYKKILDEEPSSAMELIYEDIALNYSKMLNIERIKSLNLKLDKNIIGQLILKEIVIQHFEMFPVQYSEKQKIANILGFDIKKINSRIGVKK